MAETGLETEEGVDGARRAIADGDGEGKEIVCLHAEARAANLFYSWGGLGRRWGDQGEGHFNVLETHGFDHAVVQPEASEVDASLASCSGFLPASENSLQELLAEPESFA